MKKMKKIKKMKKMKKIKKMGLKNSIAKYHSKIASLGL